MALQAELHQHVAFEEVEADEEVTRSYTLDRVPPTLQAQLKAYQDHRVSPLNRLRTGSAVVELTVAHDTSTCLRFLGWLHREHEVVPNLQGVFGAVDPPSPTPALLICAPNLS